MRLRLTILLFTMFATSVGFWGADDPMTGTWTLNVAKSVFDPGPPPKSNTIKFEMQADGGQKSTVEQVTAQGQKSNTQYTAYYDGRDCPVIDLATGKPTPTTATFQRIDAYTNERINKVGGKVMGRHKRVLSKDGKTLTALIHSVTAQGELTAELEVFEKQ